MNAKINISDRAVLRWLERVEGVNVKAIRKRIRCDVIKAVEHRSPGVIKDGVKFLIKYSCDGSATVTTTFSAVIRAHLSVARLELGNEPR